MRTGLRVRDELYRDGKLWASSDSVWDRAPNIQYFWSETHTSDGSPLPAGTYELLKYIEGTLALRGTFVVR